MHMKTTDRVKQQRERHHNALAQLAASLGWADKSKIDGLSLWRKLARVERKIHAACEDYCNGTLGEEGMDKACDRATDEVKRIFGGMLPPKFHINRDPRGHALELMANDSGTIPATKFELEQDWGRNQILAPEIN